MRRDSSEEGWGFGSRRLALAMTVLAALAVVAFALAFRASSWSSAVFPVVTGTGAPDASVQVPGSISQPVPEVVFRPPASVPETVSPTRPQLVAAAPTPRERKPFMTTSRVVAPVRSAPVVAPVASDPPAPSRDAAPTPTVLNPSAVPVAAASTERPAPETVPVPVVARELPPQTNPSSVARDRSRPSEVDRREMRREAREAADAIRDARSR